MVRAAAVLFLAGALSACAGPSWTKPGVTQAQAAADDASCRSLAGQANRRDSDIEADIMASRGRDWENSGSLGAHQAVFAAEAANRTGDIARNCMIAKGYSPAP